MYGSWLCATLGRTAWSGRFLPIPGLVAYESSAQPHSAMEEPHPPEKRTSDFLGGLSLFVMVAALLADQLSKALVLLTMYPGQSIPESGLFRFTYVKNTGSAFGLFPNQTLFLIFASFCGNSYTAGLLPHPQGQQPHSAHQPGVAAGRRDRQPDGPPAPRLRGRLHWTWERGPCSTWQTRP